MPGYHESLGSLPRVQGRNRQAVLVCYPSTMKVTAGKQRSSPTIGGQTGSCETCFSPKQINCILILSWFWGLKLLTPMFEARSHGYSRLTGNLLCSSIMTMSLPKFPESWNCKCVLLCPSQFFCFFCLFVLIVCEGVSHIAVVGFSNSLKLGLIF